MPRVALWVRGIIGEPHIPGRAVFAQNFSFPDSKNFPKNSRKKSKNPLTCLTILTSTDNRLPQSAMSGTDFPSNHALWFYRTSIKWQPYPRQWHCCRCDLSTPFHRPIAWRAALRSCVEAKINRVGAGAAQKHRSYSLQPMRATSNKQGPKSEYTVSTHKNP